MPVYLWTCPAISFVLYNFSAFTPYTSLSNILLRLSLSIISLLHIAHLIIYLPSFILPLYFFIYSLCLLSFILPLYFFIYSLCLLSFINSFLYFLYIYYFISLSFCFFALSPVSQKFFHIFCFFFLYLTSLINPVSFLYLLSVSYFSVTLKHLYFFSLCKFLFIILIHVYVHTLYSTGTYKI